MKTLMGIVTGTIVGTIIGALGFAFSLKWTAAIEDKVWIIDGEGHQFIKKEDFNDHTVEK